MAPPVEAIYAGGIGTISSRDIRPGRPRSQSPEDTIQHPPIINPRLAAHLRWKKRFNHRPFEIRQIKASHHCLQINGSSESQSIKNKNYFMGM
jgi:hypothetical protein